MGLPVARLMVAGSFLYCDGDKKRVSAIYQPPRNYRLSRKAIVTGRNRCVASDVTQVLGSSACADPGLRF